MLEFRPSTLDSDDARAFTDAVQEEYRNMYGGEGDTTPIDASEFVAPNGYFFIAYDGDTPVGMAGIRRLTETRGELKRMYVAPAYRGKGLSRELLEVAERAARAMGLDELWLETGPKQIPAVKLYTGAGYTRIPTFGPYAIHTDCLCYGKRL